MPRDPNLKLHPLTLAQVPDYARIRNTAFIPTINKILFAPGGPFPNTVARMEERYRGFVNEGCPIFYVGDEVTGEVAAIAKWRLVGKEVEVDGKKQVSGLTEQEVDKELEIPPKWPESDQEMWDKFYACLNGTTKDIMGCRPYWTLDMMATDPKHERRGAATMLVQWGCDRADELGVEAYIEASQIGTPMYERLGFKTVRRVVFDPVKEVGRDAGYAYDFNVMIRQPTAQ